MESKEPKKCPFCGADQPEGQLHITKSGFFKINPYREQEGKVSVKTEPRPIGKFWDI